MPFFVKMYFLLLKQIDIRRFHIYNFIYIGFCIFMGAEKYAIYYNNCEELDTKIKVGEVIDKIEYGYSMFHLSMDCFWTKTVANRLIPKKTEGVLLLSISCGTLIGYLLCTVFSAMSIFGKVSYHFPTVEMFSYFILMLAVQMLFSYLAIRQIKKQSLVDQIRELS